MILNLGMSLNSFVMRQTQTVVTQRIFFLSAIVKEEEREAGLPHVRLFLGELVSKGGSVFSVFFQIINFTDGGHTTAALLARVYHILPVDGLY